MRYDRSSFQSALRFVLPFGSAPYETGVNYEYGVTLASRKYNRNRSYICFWRARWDGSAESLACQSQRPHSHLIYSARSFFSLADFQKQLFVHIRRSNNLPIRPLQWLSPIDFLVLFV